MSRRLASIPGGPGGGPGTARGLRLLLIDDDPADRELAREAVGEFADDIELRTCGTLGEALTALGAGPLPHLLLVDLRLGADHGQDLVRRLRGHRAAGVPLVILTTTDDARERQACLAAGATDFWIKPVRFGDYPALLARARALADGRRAATTSGELPT